ncbi:unnamed protein product, partial [Staurois parvus]
MSYQSAPACNHFLCTCVDCSYGCIAFLRAGLLMVATVGHTCIVFISHG